MRKKKFFNCDANEIYFGSFFIPYYAESDGEFVCDEKFFSSMVMAKYKCDSSVIMLQKSDASDEMTIDIVK